MATARTVASYILEHHGPMTAMKLQKLVYYCQAWHLVRRDAALFDDEIQAWAAGPVVRSLFVQHRGRHTLSAGDLTAAEGARLTETERATVDKVVAHYGKLSATQLSDLTHKEGPWQEARIGLEPTDRGERVITPESMIDYYTSLAQRSKRGAE